MEALMQYVWQFRLWPLTRMMTDDGRRIQVLDPGLHNHDSGPDFFNAKIIIGGEYWTGNVEIHVRASDWFKHHHDTDPAYDSIILHVVERDDAEIHRSNGEKIPQMVMKCAPDFADKYNEMVNNPYRELPCGNEIHNLMSLHIHDWISALAFERLYGKVDRINSYLKDCNHNWAEAIYITLSRALGFNTNSEPFQLLAKTTPLKNMLHYTDSLLPIEAMLFGQAGLLENANTDGDKYIRQLVNEYNFLCKKFSLVRSHNICWKMSKMRPQNFPHRRIAAMAQLIYHNLLFSNNILELKSETEARQLFDIKLQGYWANHYSFSSNENATGNKAFSQSSINILLINFIVPILFAYSLHTGDLKRQEFAVDLLQSLKPESNRIIDIYLRAGITPQDAFMTQGLIQLKQTYCEQRKCLYCRWGHRFLSQKTLRV